MSAYKDFIKANVQKPEDEDILKHYGVLGMKWGVRKEYESKGRIKGPVSNKLYKVGNRSIFKNGVTTIVAGEKSSSGLRNSGARYTFQFNKASFDKVKAWKKKSASKGKSGGGKKGSSKAKAEKEEKPKTKAEKAEKALKEKKASSSKKGSSSEKKSTDKNESKKNKKVSFEKRNKDDYMSLDPDFDERYFGDFSRLGNTNFHAFKGKDGRWIISDKNKKWVLPEGIELDLKEFSEQFVKFDKKLKEIIAESDYDYSEEDLDMWYTEAINKMISKLQTPQEKAYEKIAEVINSIFSEEDTKSKDKKQKSGATNSANPSTDYKIIKKKR